MPVSYTVDNLGCTTDVSAFPVVAAAEAATAVAAVHSY